MGQPMKKNMTRYRISWRGRRAVVGATNWESAVEAAALELGVDRMRLRREVREEGNAVEEMYEYYVIDR